nr:MAG TPA: hypothetical protein [Caudoviricetes sp.]
MLLNIINSCLYWTTNRSISRFFFFIIKPFYLIRTFPNIPFKIS